MLGIFLLIPSIYLQYFGQFCVYLMDKYTTMNRNDRLLIFFFILLSYSANSQIKYSNEFLQIGAGARALSLSGAVVANTPDASSVYWNPSSLVDINQRELELMHASYFSGIANFDQISYVQRTNNTDAFGIMALRFGIDDIMNTSNLIDDQGNIDYNRIDMFSAADYAFLFSYAKKDIYKGFDIGGNLKVIYRQIGSFATSWGFGFDIAKQKRFGNWKFGAISRDVTSTFNTWSFNMDEFDEVYLETGNSFPENSSEVTLPSLQVGLARIFRINDNFSAHTEIDMSVYFDGERNSLYSSDIMSCSPHIGTEIKFKDIIDIRAGIGNVTKETDFSDQIYFSMHPNIGIGIHFSNIRIDYTLTDLGDHSSGLYSNLFSLRYSFN